MSYGYSYSYPRSYSYDDDNDNNYISYAIGALLLVIIAKIFKPDIIPFSFFEFFHLKGSIGDVLASSWVILAWGIVATMALCRIRKDDLVYSSESVSEIFTSGLKNSLFAGITEEIAFRWFIFFAEIVGYSAFNWVFGGFAGHGFPEWIYNTITGPLANYFTLGWLAPYLLGGFGWAVGAAILTSNGRFRDGHLYQGPLGWINSWILGMFFFYLMFEFGLIAAIIMHVLYDLVVYSTRGFMTGLYQSERY